MLVTFNDKYFELTSCDSKRDLIEILNQCSEGNLLLGENDEQEENFFAIQVHSGKEDKKFGIGVVSEGYGLIPSILAIPTNSSLFIGFNSEFVIIDCGSKSIRYSTKLGSLFFQFIHFPQHKIVMVLHELGLLAISEEGKEIWEYDAHDIIQDYQIEGNLINLELMDNPSARISILNGESA